MKKGRRSTLHASRPTPQDQHAESWRRFLLSLVTALLVARPFVLGEDPGLLIRMSGSANLLLSALWLLAAAGWAGWRIWAPDRPARNSHVEIGLLVLTGLAFLSAGAVAHYKHPALLIAWEWGVFLAVFAVVSRLIQSAREQRALLAAMLACAVSLSAYAIYQYTVELPRDRELLANPAALRQELARLNVGLDPDDPLLVKRVMQDNVFSTYAHPNSFAGFLALLLPAGVGWSWTSWRRHGLSSAATLTTGCTLVVLVALWLTHSRGAILGSALAGVVVLALSLGPTLWKRKTWLLGIIALAAVPLALLLPTDQGRTGLAKAKSSFGLRAGYWSTTWEIIRAHPLLGVGPGNFGRHYPIYMSPAASEKVQDPHNFLLEVWATMGLPALAVLLATLVVVGRGIWKEGSAVSRQSSVVSSKMDKTTDYGLRTTDPSPLAPRPSSLSPDPSFPILWEFYLGGMVGLLLGFLARVFDQTGGGILAEGVLAAGRSLVWFAAFAVFDLVPCSSRSIRLALTAGLLALFLNLLVSGGISQPSVAQPMWAVAALATVSFPAAASAQPRPSWIKRVWPLPVLAGVALGYMTLVYFPVTTSAGLLTQAQRYYGQSSDLPGWFNAALPEFEKETANAAGSERKLQVLLAAEQYIKTHILKPLKEATDSNPSDASPHVELAAWYLELLKLDPKAAEPARQALDEIRQARRLDPDGKDAYLQEHRLHMILAGTAGDRAAVEYGRAASALEELVKRDPTEANLRYQLAEVLFKAQNPVKGRAQVRQALALDQLCVSPERKLTSEQRQQIEGWLKGE